MLCHQFSQNLIFRLDLLLQISDSFLFRLMVGASPVLKSCRSVLEKLLLPAVEHGWLESLFVTQIRDRHSFHQMPPQNGNLLFRRACSASVASSCVRSVILTDERFLHFQLRQDSVYRRGATGGSTY